MAITVGERLELPVLIERHDLDQTEYIDRLEVRELRTLLDSIDTELRQLEATKLKLIALKKKGRDLALREL